MPKSQVPLLFGHKRACRPRRRPIDAVAIYPKPHPSVFIAGMVVRMTPHGPTNYNVLDE
jgi:hypothetical protein